MGNSFEEALSNINVFCSVLVKKIIGDEEPQIKPEPIESMLKKKYTVEVYGDLDKWEEPLVDVFEDEKQVKILMRFSFGGQEIEFHPCEDYVEIWVNKGQRFKLPIDPPNMNKTTVKCSNQVLEIIVQK